MGSIEPRRLRIANWNARSVRAKNIELSNFLAHHNIDMGVITETRLNTANNFALPTHTMVRLDRPNSSGGGVAVIIKQGIRFEILPHPKTSVIEAIGVKIHTANGYITLFAVYTPRQCVDKNGTSKHFVEDLGKLTDNRSNFIVAGDLNARHTLWRNSTCNKNGNLLADHLSTGTYNIHFPDDPTFLSPASTASTLDLFLSDLALSKPVTHHDLSSDHFPVVCELTCDPTPTAPAMRRDYHRVNWVAFSRLVDSRLPEQPDISTTDAIDNQLGVFEEAIHAAEDACIRWVPVKRTFTPIDPHTQRLIQQRNAVRRQFQRSGCLLKKLEVSLLNSQIGDRMAEIKNQQFSNNIGQMRDHMRPFWKVAKVLKKRPQAVPPLKDNTGSILVTPAEKANAIACKLVEAHNLGANMVSPHEETVRETINQLDQRIDEAPFPSQVTENEVRTAVKRGKNMKAPGDDRIYNLVLKNISAKAYRFLADIFTRCFQLGYFPTRWKIGKIVPILKPGKDPTSPASYRPISLLSAVSKIFERLILQRLMEHVEENHTIVPEQFGFRRGHSAVHQLVRVENTIQRNKALSNNTAMVLLDVEKAFDNVWHDGLVHKLVQADVPTYIVKMVRNYLSNRTFRVHLPGATSEVKAIAAGVPQGSLLGPMLYNLYTSDVPQLPGGCILALYADDSAIMANGRTPTIYRSRLQQGVTAYVAYLTSWKIKVNEAKSQAILFRHRPSPKLLPPPECFIRINGCPVDWTSEVGYLGVTIDDKLTYRAHTDNLKWRCLGLLKKLYPLIKRRSRLSRRNKLAVFNAIIAPMVNYAMPSWGTCAATHKRKLQVVQNRLLRTILDVPNNTRVSELHRAAGCKTIEERVEDAIDSLFVTATASEYPLIRALVM